MIQGASYSRDLGYLAELRHYAAQLPNLHYLPTVSRPEDDPSWEGATGRLTDAVFCDNTKAWSGDHCVDPNLVPGVLFASRPIRAEDPGIEDLAPTILDAFGVDVPGHMTGRRLEVRAGSAASAQPA